MRTRTKPLMFAIALALGASAPAFGQSSGGAAGDSGMSTNTRTAPAVVPLPSQAGNAPVVSGDSTPVVSGSAAVTPLPDTTAAPVTPDEEHGGLRNRLRDHDADEEHHGSAAYSDDAREHAERNARSSDEEEHGGTRNWIHQKKDRAREKLGLGHDDD